MRHASSIVSSQPCPIGEGAGYADVGLKIYQFVRYNFLHPSFLLYRLKKQG